MNMRTSANGGMPSGHAGSDHEGPALVRNIIASASTAGELTPSKKRKTGKDKTSVLAGDVWEDEELSVNRRSPALAKKPVSGSLAGHAAKESRSIAKKRR